MQEGDSIAAQRNALRQYINDHQDMIFVGEYLDDGISGTKYDRDELQHLLADVKAGKIDLIICTKMDRLHRSLRNFLNMQDVLNKYNCNWLAIWEPMYDSTTPQGRMIINTMMNLAQFEAEQTGQRIRQVNTYKVSQGEVVSGKVPVGYRIEDKHLVQNEYAAAVKKVFENYSLYGNLRQTALYASSFEGMPKSINGVKKLLKTEKYTGFYRQNYNYCPPIISRDLFEDVQRKLKMNVKESQKHIYVFSGILICAECGRHMAGVYKVHHNKAGRVDRLYYRCPGYYINPVHYCANAKTISEHKIEKVLMSKLKPWISDFIVSVTERQKKPNDIRVKKESITRKLSRLKELYVNDMISIDEYKADREKYLMILEELSKDPDEPVVDTTSLQAYLDMDLETYYDDLTPDEKRFFWRSIFKSITFNQDRTLDPDFL